MKTFSKIKRYLRLVQQVIDLSETDPETAARCERTSTHLYELIMADLFEFSLLYVEPTTDMKFVKNKDFDESYGNWAKI